MKTPDEIKKGLELCGADECHENQHKICPYKGDVFCIMHTCGDALAYIQQLEAQNTELLEKVEQLKAERDAAVRDCGCFPCQTCEERENGDLCPMCEIQGGYRKFHQWCGVQKEETP